MIQTLHQRNVPNEGIHCLIVAPQDGVAQDISRIAQYCAIDLKLAIPLIVEAGQAAKTHITLSVNLESTLSSNAIWRLATRIAAFCPQSRVSSVILGNQTTQKSA